MNELEYNNSDLTKETFIELDKIQLTKYRRTIQTLRARGRIKSETFGDMGQCQRKKGFTLLEVDALKYLLQEFPIHKSRDEEIEKLKAIEKDAIRMDKNITKLQDIILARDEEIEGYKSDIKARVELRAEDRRMLKINDEEINDRKLECIDYQETIIKQQAEIKKLREDLREINCMAQDYVVGNVDIYTAMDSIVCHTEEALKGII